MVTFLLILSPIYLQLVATENCSVASTCYSCLSKHPSCYWCTSSPLTSGCVKFTSDTIADIFCRSLWIHDNKLCPHQYLSESGEMHDFSNELFNQQSSPKYSQVPWQGTKNKDLEELLHKLLLLKLLHKIKNEGDLNEKEKDLLFSLKERIRLTAAPTSTTATVATKNFFPSKRFDVDMELTQLLKILKNETIQKLSAGNEENKLSTAPIRVKSILKSFVDVGATIDVAKSQALSSMNIKSTKPVSEYILPSKTTNFSVKKKSNKSQPAPTKGGATIQAVNRVKQGAATYEEKVEENVNRFAKKLQPKYFNTIPKPQVKSKLKIIHISEDGHYCNLYEKKSLCNSAHNCTWCNTLDICIPRNDLNYQKCVSNAKNLVDSEYGLDRCFKSKQCKQCVQDEKCYWCDTSQRCHTYPFIGYVPNSCGGDWYVKQCDVQLVIIIVALPLFIILIAMLTFYFCLKYCHYRRKVLRVPLFEKPGIFDYRKDKKVYYVTPESESDDDGLSKENITKRYRIPVEKEPLIDPNT